MNEKRLPKLMVLIVILKGEKVYKVPVRSEIELDHLKDFNTLTKKNPYSFSTTISWSRF